MEENTKKHVTCRSLRLAFLMTIILLLAYPKNRNSADAGGTDWAHFNQPTDVAIATAIFVADGYVNMRVVKYDHNRNFLLSWGLEGTGKGQFETDHSIVIDGDLVYVADRENPNPDFRPQ